MKKINVPIPENRIARFGSNPISSGPRIVDPDMTMRCCMPIGIIEALVALGQNDETFVFLYTRHLELMQADFGEACVIHICIPCCLFGLRP